MDMDHQDFVGLKMTFLSVSAVNGLELQIHHPHRRTDLLVMNDVGAFGDHALLQPISSRQQRKKQNI